MTTITPDQLRQMMPTSGSHADDFAGPLSTAVDQFDISNPARLSAFLAELAEESGCLAHTVENLNYGAPALTSLFPSHFSSEDAQSYARQPERIANRLYANRMGNGDEASGDGWAFRGRGLIQITGRANYTACAAALGLPLLDNPDLLAAPDAAALSAAWFWSSHGLNDLADAGDFQSITRRINGGLMREAEREAYWQSAKAVFGS